MSDVARDALHCWVYRGGKRGESYLYVPGAGDFSRVPAGLLGALGRLELAMELDLHPGRRLARADAGQIMRALREHGFYLQLPPVDTPDGARVQ